MSNASTSSLASSGGAVKDVTVKSRKSKSRAEMLRDLSVLNQSSALLDSEVAGKKEEVDSIPRPGSLPCPVQGYHHRPEIFYNQFPLLFSILLSLFFMLT